MAGFDRDDIRRAISEMACREISFERSLNLKIELAGDEVQSIFERICDRYAVDSDCLWQQIDFDRYFLRELNMFELLYSIIKNIGERNKKSEEYPFFIDDLVEAMNKCVEAKLR